MYYDENGRTKAYAAECYDEFVRVKVSASKEERISRPGGLSTRLHRFAERHPVAAQAIDEGWILVDSFKVLLNPPTIAPSTLATSTPRSHLAEPDLVKLPFGVGIEQVYADFLGYLWKNTKGWYGECTPK